MGGTSSKGEDESIARSPLDPVQPKGAVCGQRRNRTMNGVHDLGGIDGFGAVHTERDEPVFHADWERRVFGMTAVISAAHLRNVHRFRHAIERMEPQHYLGSSYYEHWLTALATLLIESGMITAAELNGRVGAPFPVSRPMRGDGALAAAESAAQPRFVLGARVRIRNEHPLGHTRCPRYVRGKRGVIVRVDGRFPLPDAAAHDGTRCEQHQYTVRFSGPELWGSTAGPAELVHVDLSEGYLEPA